MQGIYGVYDNKAEAIVGGLYLFRQDAAAIRMFGDIASDPKTLVGMHTEDYDLLLLGMLQENSTLTATDPIKVMTGAAWLAAQQARNPDVETH